MNGSKIGLIILFLIALGFGIFVYFDHKKEEQKGNELAEQYREALCNKKSIAYDENLCKNSAKQ